MQYAYNDTVLSDNNNILEQNIEYFKYFQYLIKVALLLFKIIYIIIL